MVTPQGGLYGCGLNEFGQVGVKHPADITSVREYSCKPVFTRLTPGNIPVKQVTAAGNHTMVLTQDGRLFECGMPGYIDCAETNYLKRISLENIPQYSCIKQIFVHKDFSLLLTNDGDFYGRGKLNLLICLFNFNLKKESSDSETDSESESDIIMQSFTLLKKNQNLMNIHVKDIVIGEEGHVVILTNDSIHIYQPGYQLSKMPLGEIPINASFQKIVMGTGNILVLTDEGKLYGVGDNTFGALGLHKDTRRVTSFVRLFSELGDVCIKEVASLGHRTMLLTKDGKLYGCGANESGALGIPSCYSESSRLFYLSEIPLGEIPENAVIQQITLGPENTFVVTDSGYMYGCGVNRYGELGIGDTKPKISFTLCPMTIEGLSPVQEKKPPCCIQ